MTVNLSRITIPDNVKPYPRRSGRASTSVCCVFLSTVLLLYSEAALSMATGSVTLRKNDKNMIGISIGGGAPYCPVLYIVQLFDKTPAGDSSLMLPGDVIVGVNDKSVRGLSRSQLANAIKAIKVGHGDYLFHCND